MSIPPSQLGSNSDQTTQPDFEEGTLGAFMVQGQSGWPHTFGAHIDGAYINVASSEVRFERQLCCAPTSVTEEPCEVVYVRVSLDVMVERDGTIQLRHVEELFPSFIMEVLNMPLDEHAAARVRRTISETLLSLDDQEPVDHFLNDMIAPMRLYEPLLNALIAPPDQDSLAAWLGQHIEHIICPNDRTLAEVTVNGCRVRVKAREVAMQHNLRASGEVKLIGEVEVSCAHTGAKQGEWKSRAVIMKPSLIARSLPTPDDSSQAHFDMLTSTWRERLEQNLSARLAQGTPGRFRLSEVLPELALCLDEDTKVTD